MANDWYSEDDLKIQPGSESVLKTYINTAIDAEGGEVRRNFCGVCGSPVYITSARFPNVVAVTRGTNDGPHGREHAAQTEIGWQGENISDSSSGGDGKGSWKPQLEVYTNRRMTYLSKVEDSTTFEGMS